MKEKLKTIKGRLTGTIVAVVSVALIILVTVVMYCTKETLLKEQEATLKVRATKYAEQFNTFFEDKMSLIEGVADGVVISGEYKDKNMVKTVIRGYKSVVDDSIADMYIAYNDKKLYMMSGSEEGLPADFDARERDWYKQAVQTGTTIVSSPYVDQVSGNMMITVATPIMDNNTLIGVAGEDVYITELVEVTKEINFESGTYGFLLDRNQNYVYHPNEEYNPTSEEMCAVDEDTKQLLDSDKDALFMKDYAGKSVYVSTSQIDKCNWTLGIALPESYIHNKLSLLIVMSIVISFVMLSIIVVLVTIIIKKSLKPVQTMKNFVKESIIGEENCKNCKDEVAEIDYLVMELKEHFINTIKQTKLEAVNIKDKITNTSTQMDNISESIMEISSTMEETSASFETQTKSIDNINTTCKSAGCGVENLAKEAQDIASRANDIIKRVEQLTPSIISSKNSTIQMTTASKADLKVAIEGASNIQDIEEVSKAIEGIAEQTNLLALNASIEAARAGEAGRGFSVVADEIRNLSETTNKEISKINSIVQSVVSSVGTLSTKSKEMVDFIDNNVIKDYDLLENLATNYHKDASYYSDVSSNLSSTSQELNASVQEITSVLEAINTSQEHLNTGVQVVNENLQQITINSEATIHETEDAVSSAERLLGTVNQFNL